MNKDLESLLELQRKTKAGEVAPLVDVAIKHFWLWPGKAYWAYVRRAKIAIEQLELRKNKGLVGDPGVANVVSLIGQVYNEEDWPERGALFLHLIAEDAWPMVAMLLEDDLVDIELFGKMEQQYGKSTIVEKENSINTVGELSRCLGMLCVDSCGDCVV